ncbi:MAG: hypothetical protein AB2L09_07315 [Coriobacteriia bacterium]
MATEDKSVLKAKVVNEKGAPLLVISKIGREGDDLTVTGSLMGAWESTMYMKPEDLLVAVQIVLNQPEVFKYLLDLPSILKNHLAQA